MSRLNEKEILQQLKETGAGRLYLFCGQEEFSKDLCLKKLISAAVSKGFESFNLQTFDGDQLKVDQLADAVYALPLMSDHKCVLVRNLNMDTIKPTESAKLYELLSDLSDTTTLIFVIKGMEINPKHSAKWRKFIDTVDKNGVVAEFERKNEASILKLIADQAKKHNCTIETNAAKLLAARCLNDMSSVVNEMNKLCAHALSNQGVITIDSVAMLVSEQTESTAFELARAIVRNDYNGALARLDTLYSMREEPINILAAISSAFVDMYRVKALKSSGVDIYELSKVYDYKGKEFRIKNAAYDSGKYTLSFLRGAIKQLMEADIALKSTRMDNRVILERALTGIFMQK